MTLRAFVAAVCAFALSSSASAQTAFVPVVDTTNTTYERFGTAPALSNTGQLVFYAERGTTYNGAFSTSVSGGAITTIADSDGAFSQLGGLYSVNAAGAVAFTGTKDAGGTGIFKWSTATGITDVSQPAATFLSFGGPPQMNADGTVAFFATRAPAAPIVRGVFTGDGTSSATTVADNSATYSVFGEGPSINADGTVVFFATKPATADAGLYRGAAAGGATTAIIENNSSPLHNFAGDPSVNATGRVAFRAVTDAGSLPGLFTVNLDGTGLTTLATTAGPFSQFESPVINARGTIAFRAFLDSGGHGIFTGADPNTDKVIATGDSLFGSSVLGLGFYRGLNDFDQLAFWYVLADGRSGVAVANLSPVPEPTVVVLIGAAALVLARAGRRRYQRAGGSGTANE